MLWAALALGVVGGILNAGANMEQSKEQQSYLTMQNQARIDEANAQLALDKEQAFTQADSLDRQAAQIEMSARTGFGLSMNDTYLSQKQGEAQYLQMLTEGDRAISAQSAIAGASGVKNSGTTALLSEQAKSSLADQASLARETLDRSLAGSIQKAQFNLSDSLFRATEARTSATDLRGQFDEGSAYMNLFNQKMSDAQKLYQTQYDSLTYDWSKPETYLRVGADFMGGFNSGFNSSAGTYLNGKNAGWWK